MALHQCEYEHATSDYSFSYATVTTVMRSSIAVNTSYVQLQDASSAETFVTH